jgi:hypothetical protein
MEQIGESNIIEPASIQVMGASVASGSAARQAQIICLAPAPIIPGLMFAFACIAGGLIVACTVLALLVPLGPEVTLSDIARQMETTHRSQRITSSRIACLTTGAKLKLSGQVKERERAAREPGNCN